MTLASLQGLPLRLIALKLSDPGPLSQSCSAAYTAIYKDEAQLDFELEWFLRWVHVLAPLRPWQFAAVGWQRLGGQHATAEQLCGFILRVCAAKRQQQLLLHTGSSSMRPRNSRPVQPSGIQQQPEPTIEQEVQVLLQQLHVDLPAQQPEAADSAAAVEPVQFLRPRFSPMPQCLPKLSLEQQAQKLLSQGHALRALRLLCDGPPWLLYQYAAAAGNMELLQLSITEQNKAQLPQQYRYRDFPDTHIQTSGGGFRYINPAQLCAYAAMRKGHVHVLSAVLLRGGSSIHTYMLHLHVTPASRLPPIRWGSSCAVLSGTATQLAFRPYWSLAPALMLTRDQLCHGLSTLSWQQAVPTHGPGRLWPSCCV
jgi:hypothetical protein